MDMEWFVLKTRKQEYGTSNMIGKNLERIRKEKGIKQAPTPHKAVFP